MIQSTYASGKVMNEKIRYDLSMAGFCFRYYYNSPNDFGWIYDDEINTDISNRIMQGIKNSLIK